jgi:antitoxin (DNA-binding transcriptional repressor) of toxin-antitoxin stability system
MIHVDVQQAQADLARYLERVACGETVVVCKDNEPIAEIRPVAVPARRTGPRPLGLGQGLGQVPPAFFDPLPPDLLAAFNGEEP